MENSRAVWDVSSGFRVGVDAVPLARVKEMMEKHGPRFVGRFLSEREIAYCLPESLKTQTFSLHGISRVSFYRVAGRIAAKEAVMKVLGEGWPRIPWNEVEILPGYKRRPIVALGGKVLSFMKEEGIIFQDIQVSITHDRDLALAFAMGVSQVAPVR